MEKKIEKSNILSQKKNITNLKNKILITLIIGNLTLNPLLNQINKKFPNLVELTRQLFIQNTYAATISWESLNNLETIDNIEIKNIYGYIEFNFAFGFADGKYKIKNRKISKNGIPKKLKLNIDGQILNINLKDPFIIITYLEKKKGIIKIQQKLGLLFEKRDNNLIFLGVIKQNKFYPLREPQIYKIKKIEYIIQQSGQEIIVSKGSEQNIEINLPKIRQLGIENGKIKINIDSY